MANKIQIKRSTSNATVTGLSNGELAFTQASNTLHIGLPDGSGVLRIGGAQYPGTLTNNHSLVANTTGGIDKIITANLVTQEISANGSSGTSGQALFSGGSGSNVYWGSISGVNADAQYTWTNTHSFTNTTASSNTTTGAVTIAGGLGVAGRINTAEIAVGNDSVYSTANGTVISTINVFATGTVNASTLSVGGWVIANNSGVFTSGVVNGDIIRVGTNIVANTTQFTLASGIKFAANGAVGSANQVLRSDSTGVAYWSTDDGDISSVVAGSGLTGGGSSGEVTINVGSGNGISVSTDAISVSANDGIVSNSSGVFVKAGTGVTVNATGVHIGQSVATTDNVTFANVVTTDLTVNGNAVIGSDSSDKITVNARVESALVPTANNTYDLGTNTLRWANLYLNHISTTDGATFGSNVSIAGSLTISGNLVTQNVQSIIVSDPLIYLAGNNYTSDLVDIGLAANYNDGVTNRHTGFFRDHTDGIWKLFTNLTQELSGNNDIDTSDPSYQTATLVAYLASGALTTNTTAVAITANSTISVSIVANTLTLSSPLIGTSGGTGLASYTAEDILVANSSNGFRKLGLGTDGLVLQSNGSALVYDTIDAGTF